MRLSTNSRESVLVFRMLQPSNMPELAKDLASFLMHSVGHSRPFDDSL